MQIILPVMLPALYALGNSPQYGVVFSIAFVFGAGLAAWLYKPQEGREANRTALLKLLALCAAMVLLTATPLGLAIGVIFGVVTGTILGLAIWHSALSLAANSLTAASFGILFAAAIKSWAHIGPKFRWTIAITGIALSVIGIWLSHVFGLTGS